MVRTTTAARDRDIADMTKRLTAMLALALVLFAAALPSAAACCVGMAGASSSMHASMPCCGEGCTMSPRSSGGRDRDAALTPPPVPQPAAAVATIVTTQAPQSSAPATVQPASNYSPPPPFLLHEQFRI